MTSKYQFFADDWTTKIAEYLLLWLYIYIPVYCTYTDTIYYKIQDKHNHQTHIDEGTVQSVYLPGTTKQSVQMATNSHSDV